MITSDNPGKNYRGHRVRLTKLRQFQLKLSLQKPSTPSYPLFKVGNVLATPGIHLEKLNIE